MSWEKLQAIEWVLSGSKSKAEVAWLLGISYSVVCTLTRGYRSPAFRYTRIVPNKYGGEEMIFTNDPTIGRAVMSLESRESKESDPSIGDMKWLISQTGWTHDKISRLARIRQIKGAFQAQPRTHGSMWCFRKAKTLAWLDSLETK